MAKTKLELVTNEDGNTYLNFWNWYNGKDVVCQVINGKLIDDNGEGHEITLLEFIDRVKERIAEHPKPTFS